MLIAKKLTHDNLLCVPAKVLSNLVNHLETRCIQGTHARNIPMDEAEEQQRGYKYGTDNVNLSYKWHLETEPFLWC